MFLTFLNTCSYINERALKVVYMNVKETCRCMNSPDSRRTDSVYIASFSFRNKTVKVLFIRVLWMEAFTIAPPSASTLTWSASLCSSPPYPPHPDFLCPLVCVTSAGNFPSFDLQCSAEQCSAVKRHYLKHYNGYMMDYIETESFCAAHCGLVW